MTAIKRFTPYVSSRKKMVEFSAKAVILGIILSFIFCIGNAYLGLKVGMTISASIPAAVLSMAILRTFFKSVTILENNLVQTMAAVGEGLAAGIIFTIPALFLLGASATNTEIFVLSILGGILGILFMIPMRRYIIVEEHQNLPFPEGTACAEILKAGEKGSKGAIKALWGMIIGALFKVGSSLFLLWNDLFTFVIKPFEKTEFRMEGSPALLGVGYVIGPQIASLSFAGSILGWWVIIPLIKLYGLSSTIIPPSTVVVSAMSASDIWSNYIRYIGAGAVAIGGLYNLIHILPMMIKTIHIGFKELFAPVSASKALPRLERDISLRWLILGSLAIILTLWLFPLFKLNFFTIILLVILGYFFVAVTSITVGLVGSSSNPVSGMIITTILLTSMIFLALGWEDKAHLITIVIMGSVVSVALCLASTTSQDLKTGFLLGATPRSQQIAEIIGLILPSICIGFVIILLNKAYGFGTIELPAPQATLMKIIIEGVMQKTLPTMLIGIGVILGILLIILRIKVLPFAIGLYLPLEITTAIMVGGLVKAAHGRKDDSQASGGILAASGLIAGDALVGVLIALFTVTHIFKPPSTAILNPVLSPLFYVGLAIVLYFLARDKKS